MQVKVANFTPTTTLSGAPTVMSIVNGKRDDLVAWALGPGCLDVGPHPTVNQSAQYTIASPTEAVSLHKGTNPGVYKFCFKPKRGLWTQITYFFLTILARPIFLPVAGFAGVVTQVVFDASVTAKDGDFVVLHNTTCDNAQLHTTGFSLYIPSPPPSSCCPEPHHMPPCPQMCSHTHFSTVEVRHPLAVPSSQPLQSPRSLPCPILGLSTCALR